MVLVELACGDVMGVGYTYTHSTAAPLAQSLIDEVIVGSDPFESSALFSRLRYKQRNYGRSGIAVCALSAIDIALWDLRSKLMDQPLVRVLGQMREAAQVYGSGGFTTYTDAQLRNQLSGWVSEGIPRVKMKIGQHPDDDLRRIAVARDAIGPDAELFIDANGAYSRKQALDMAHRARNDYGVIWFEEPVTSDDLDGLHLIRNSGPAGMEIAAGEYGFDAMYLKRMITAEAVHVIQADATRCGGVTGFMDAAAVADAHSLPLSAHCAPSLHMHLACAARPLRYVEYFHDHVRIEKMLFDGFREPVNGSMSPDSSSARLGLIFKHDDAEQFRVVGEAR